jgi:hypothetical protein
VADQKAPDPFLGANPILHKKPRVLWVSSGMKAKKNIEEQIGNLRRELAGIRRASLAAARKGDFMRTARLTTMAQSLNRAILEAEGLASIELA